MDIENFSSSNYVGTKSYNQWDVKTANATGFGAAADDYMERGIDLNEQLVKNKPATFFMKVKGGSGDIVIVDRSLVAKSGKIIIAVIDGEMLIRRYEKSINKIRLVAESETILPIEINEFQSFEIWGVVTYVIKNIS